MSTTEHVPPGDDGERIKGTPAELLDFLDLVRSEAFDTAPAGAFVNMRPLEEEAVAEWLRLRDAASPSRTGDDLWETLAAVLAEHVLLSTGACTCGVYPFLRVDAWAAHVADALADTLGEAGHV